MSTLIEAMLRVTRAKQMLHAALRDLLTPTSAGYQGAQGWAIEPWEDFNERGICALITPPEGAHEWRVSTSEEKLQTIKARIGCDRIYARANDAPGRITYLAVWDAQPTQDLNVS